MDRFVVYPADQLFGISAAAFRDVYSRRRTCISNNSLENYEDTVPDGGVGSVQDYSDTTSDVARIRD